MIAFVISVGFIILIISIIAYAVKTVYDLMDDVDDKQNTNHPKKSNYDDKK